MYLKRAADIATVIIAGVALWVAWQEGKPKREHDRLSVKPYVDLSLSIDPFKGSGYDISNTGIGPAHIQWIKVYFDNKPVKNWIEIIENLGVRNIYTPTTYFSFIGSDSVMPINSNETLLSIGREDDKDFLDEGKDRIRIEVCYCSFYKDCWLATSDSKKVIETECSIDDSARAFRPRDISAEMKRHPPPPGFPSQYLPPFPSQYPPLGFPSQYPPQQFIPTLPGQTPEPYPERRPVNPARRPAVTPSK
jgi:hypothetical protein